MKKTLLITGIALLGTQGMANNLDALGDIKIVDESAKSALFQREKIVGCTDYGTKKELSCAKKPKDAILSKLPTSQQLSSTNFDDKDARENIKTKLLNIIEELKQLKQEQKVDKATIKQLQNLITVISDKKPTSSKQKMNIVKKGIQKISKKQTKSYTATIIRKKIKEVSRTESQVVVEVQRNESLSTYAQAFYGDNTKYYRIYKANKDKLNTNMQIIIGQRLTIPLP